MREVLHGGLVGAPLLAQESDQDVGRYGHQLQAHEDGDQVDGSGHEHHAGRGEKEDGVVLAVLGVLDVQVPVRQGDRQDGRDQEEDSEDFGEGVLGHHVVKGGPVSRAPQPPELQRGPQQPAQGKCHRQGLSPEPEEPGFPPGQDEVDAQESQAPDDQMQLRCDGPGVQGEKTE